MKFSDVLGVGILCGMGLTVSLVIAEIVGVSADELQGIKSGLIAVILTSAIVGYLWFMRFPAEQYRLARATSTR